MDNKVTSLKYGPILAQLCFDSFSQLEHIDEGIMFVLAKPDLWNSRAKYTL